MSSFSFNVPVEDLSNPLTLSIWCCLLIILAFIVIILLVFLFRIIIEFLPATVLAVAVYFLTGGNWVYALLTFGVVALVMYLVRNRKGPKSTENRRY